MHNTVRNHLIQHISHNIHQQPIPNTGGQTFFESISAGVGQQTESIRTGGQSDQIYTNVNHYYLHLMSHPRAYATEIEIVAAQQLYNIQVRVTMAGNPYPDSPPSSSTYLVTFSTVTNTTHP